MTDGLFEMERVPAAPLCRVTKRQPKSEAIGQFDTSVNSQGARPTGVRRQTCPWCQEAKPAIEFGRSPSGWIVKECIACADERLARWEAVERRPVVIGRRYVDTSASELICTRCGRSRPLSGFYTYSDGRSDQRYYRPKCRQCMGAQQNERRRKKGGNPEQKRRDRNMWLLKQYGITADDYDRMFEEQGGRCAICGTDEPGGPTSTSALHVDHCHSTGMVRGLLCRGCNTAIGLLHEDAHLIHAALAYLEARASQPIQIGQAQ